MKLPDLQSHFRRYSTAYVVLIVAGAVLLNFHAAEANPLEDIAKSITRGFASLLLLITQAIAGLIMMFSHLLVIAAMQKEFINADVVKTGWVIVRDITNMFFIIALLVIAAGTILRIENYRYNRLLAKLIIMAFLTNFSLLIAGFFIQFAQVVMLTFVNSFREALFGNIADLFGLTKYLEVTSVSSQLPADLDSYVVSLIAGLVFLIVALIVVIAITMILVIRIIALWILCILSPLAFALRILPNTEGYAKQWWSHFGKYVTIGPVLAFVLWLSLAIVSGSDSATSIFSDADQGEYAKESMGYFSGIFTIAALEVGQITKFLVGITFLFMGLNYAMQSGVVGAKAAGKLATGIGLGVTGVSWLRDRTVAPVQGWMAARKSRQKEAIGRRTESLQFATDYLGSKTVGQVGKLKEGATKAGVAALRGVGQVVTRKATVGEAVSRVGAAAQAGFATGTEDYRESKVRQAKHREQTRARARELTPVEKMKEEDRRALALGGSGDERMIASRVMAVNRELDFATPDLKQRRDNKNISEELGRDALSNSRSISDINKSIEGIDPEVVEQMFAQFGGTGFFKNMVRDNNRLLLASIGRFAEAFGSATNEAAEYIEKNSRRVKELIRKGLISTATVNKRPLMEKIHDLPGVGSEDFIEGLKSNRILQHVYADRSLEIAADFNAANDYQDTKWVKLVREVNDEVFKGGKHKTKDAEGNEVDRGNVLHNMYLEGATNVNNALDELGRDIRAHGKEYTKFDFTDAAIPDNVKQSYRDNVSANALINIYDKNARLADHVLGMWKAIQAGTAIVMPAPAVVNSITGPNGRIHRTQRGDVLSGQFDRAPQINSLTP